MAERGLPDQQSWLHAVTPSDTGTSVIILPKGSGKEGPGHLGLWGVDDPNDGKDLDLGTTDYLQTALDNCLELAISADGMKIAILNSSNIIELWRFSKENNRWDLHWTSVLPYDAKSPRPQIKFSSDGTRVSSQLASRHSDHCHVTVWCVDNKDCEFEYEGSETLNLAVLSHHHAMVAIGGMSSSVELRDISNKTVRIIETDYFSNAYFMKFSAEDTRIAIGWDNRKVSIHNIAMGETEWVFECHATLAIALQFCPNDSWREVPFYTLDLEGDWIVHDNKKVMAIPPNLSAALYDPDQDQRANTIAFFTPGTHTSRLVYFMFEGVPSF
ncbi:hypothetical protein N7453_003211 [Penicillium expansum]|nr:hypothetical protein N7453_003211 [Penicillium expansum]